MTSYTLNYLFCDLIRAWKFQITEVLETRNSNQAARPSQRGGGATVWARDYIESLLFSKAETNPSLSLNQGIFVWGAKWDKMPSNQTLHTCDFLYRYSTSYIDIAHLISIKNLLFIYSAAYIYIGPLIYYVNRTSYLDIAHPVSI